MLVFCSGANMLSLLKVARAFDTSLSELLDGLDKFPVESVGGDQKERSCDDAAAMGPTGYEFVVAIPSLSGGAESHIS
jgi:hypothetical protein